MDERGVKAITAQKMIFEDRPSYTLLPAARREPSLPQKGARLPPIHDDKRFYLVVEDGSHRSRYKSQRTYSVDDAASLIRRFGTLPFEQVERLMRKDGI
ncbi:hypothetical protein [Aureimonas sp. ME7]|uniref:hypothetical protein n=1 Tax=Aureimonas sp. ME7 TaxID=2744252 RepID=UPI0015F6ADCA|nr:hypothetical protein [Aureimonas sp. ME7]